MGKVTRTAISFDKEFLRKLNEDANSSVKIVKGVKRLPIRPFQLANINTSVKDILQKQIAKYDQGLGGILLGYQNVQCLASDPFTFDGSFTHLDIGAEFYMFKPKRGDVLTGIVNKKSKDHVGCLIYNTFNASLPKPKDDDSWLGHKAQIGNEVKFKITFTDLESRLPYIRGEIESIACDDSGFSTEDGSIPRNTIIKFDESDEEQLGSKLEECEETKPSKKKKKRKSIEAHENVNIEIDDNEIVKSKKKKKKSINISLDDVEHQDTSDVVKKHKKKKHKHSRSEVLMEETGEETRKSRKVEVEEESTSERKKHKRKKLQKEIEECLEEVNVSRSREKKSKKKKKSEETVDNPVDENVERKKKKKNKNKSYDMSVDDCPDYDKTDKESNKIKKKKHKHKSRESDPYDLQEQVTECARKEKKHKKKKKKDVEDA